MYDKLNIYTHTKLVCSGNNIIVLRNALVLSVLINFSPARARTLKYNRPFKNSFISAFSGKILKVLEQNMSLILNIVFRYVPRAFRTIFSRISDYYNRGFYKRYQQ